MAGLNPGGRRPAGDDGTADPTLAAVLARYAAGQESERVMLTALARSRLLVPLVERPGDDTHDHQHGDDGCDHRMARDMAFPTLIGRDGRPALLAFTSLAALLGWRAEARPVPTPAGQVWGSAVDGQCAVVIDVAGPVPVAVDGARLAALAAGEPPPEPHTDPDIRADVAAALAAVPARPGFPGVAGADLAPGPDGTDLSVRLLLQPAAPNQPGSGPPAAGRQLQQAVQQAAEAIAARLSGRLRRGIEFSAAAAPRPRG
ncbi:MAG TPA: SseB family protein [Streptosporangiaceae bacterium]